MDYTVNYKLVCSFCKKSHLEVKKIVRGDIKNICNECIALCEEIIAEDEFERQLIESKPIEDLSPREIVGLLSDYVVGQAEAKKTVSVALRNHYKRIGQTSLKEGEAEIQKSNILFIGPTGCGKTLMAKALAKIADVPFVIADATALTEAGYIGEDVEEIILSLLKEANYNIVRAEKGIVYIDEIDKLATAFAAGRNRDVSGVGVQQALLKVIEGRPVKVQGKKLKFGEVEVDTSNILFIMGGVFKGLDKIISLRTGKGITGFNPRNKLKVAGADNNISVEIEDLVKFGLIPEFLGRLPIWANFHSLDKIELRQVLTEPKNALVKQYQKLFKIDGISLRFTPGALSFIASKAFDINRGARSLRAIMEKLLLNLMYEAPSDKSLREVLITESFVHGQEDLKVEEKLKSISLS